MATLWAVSDLHVSVAGNEAMLDRLHPESPEDWLLVAGDVAERQEDILSTLALLARRYRQVVWAPGNHELFSVAQDEATGRKKYDALIRGCRELGVLSPEDPYANFYGVRVVPLFTLYDYSLRPPAASLDQAMASARRKGVMLSDEMFIAPYVDIRGWCWERLSYSVNRVGRLSEPCVLMNHWPLEPALLEVLAAPEMSLWCGTKHTRGWAERYHAKAVVYGHLHTPGVQTIAGVPHHEVSLGYPKQWRGSLEARRWPVPVLEVDHGA